MTHQRSEGQAIPRGADVSSDRHWLSSLANVTAGSFALGFVLAFVLTLMGATIDQIMVAVAVAVAWDLLFSSRKRGQ